MNDPPTRAGADPSPPRLRGDPPENRILLHLWENRTPRGRFEAGKALTEAGMMRSLGLPRVELKRLLARLEGQGMLSHRTQYVVGFTEMRFVYHLTRRGEREAQSLRGTPPPGGSRP